LFKVKVPVAPDSTAEPSSLVPLANVTLPVGTTFPPAAFTVAVNTVVAAFVPGLADAAIVVRIGGAVTLTLIEVDELVKLPDAA
jgi:hypothetical protein